MLLISLLSVQFITVRLESCAVNMDCSELIVGENSENRGARKRMKRKTKREQEYEAR